MRKGWESAAEEKCGNLNDGADCDNGKPVCIVFAVEVEDGVVESDCTAYARASAMVSFTTSSHMTKMTYRSAAPKMPETAIFFLMLICRRETA